MVVIEHLIPRLVLFAATGLAVLSFCWLVVRAFGTGFGWGLGVLVCPPLGLAYAARHGREAREPLAWTLLSATIAVVTGFLAFRPRSLGPVSEVIGQWFAVEQTALWILLAGILLILVGFIALVAEAFLTRWPWGLGVLVLPVFVAPIFAVRHWRPARWPLALMILGIAVAATPIVTARLKPIDLGERERMVNGERHLTLTGWDRPPSSYILIRRKPDLVVLQMANPDVTDETLRYLEGLDRLRVLDVSHSQISDAGLAALSGLPALETLYLSHTKITDEGFQTHIAPLPALKQLDVRDTKISPERIQEWRRQKPGRRALLK